MVVDDARLNRRLSQWRRLKQPDRTVAVFAKRLRTRFPAHQGPFSMTLTVADLLTLDRTKDEFLNRAESIVGTTASGELNRSSDHPQLIRSSQKMGIPHYRNSLVWAIHALYILITRLHAPLVQTLFRDVWRCKSVSPWIVATVDHIGRHHPHLHHPWLWSLGLRYFQNRPLLARTGHRTGNWRCALGASTLKVYVSKLSRATALLPDVHGESTGSHAASFWASSRPRDISVLRRTMADAARCKRE